MGNGQVAAVTAKLDSDTKGFEQGFDRATAKTEELEKQTKHTEEAISGLGKTGVEAMEGLHEGVAELVKGFAVATLAAGAVEKAAEIIKDVAVEMVNNAAAAQMIGVQFKAAFGSSSEEVGEWAEKTGAALGRSQDDLMKVATSARVMVGGLGVGGEAADSMAEALAKMATQMSIAKGIPLDEAMQKLNAGMHGAGRGLYEYGIALNSTTQNAKALELGLGDSYSTLTQAEQAQVNFNVMMDASAKLASDAAAATGTYTNQVASLKSSWEEMTAHLGADALPTLTSIVSTVNDLVKGFDTLGPSTKAWTIALAMGPIGQAVKAAKDVLADLRGLVYKNDELPTAEYKGGPDASEMKAAIEKDARHDKDEEASADATDQIAEARRLAAARALAAEVAKLNAQKLKDLHELIAEEEKADAARIKAQADIAAARKAADQDYIKDAQEALADAQKNLSNASNGGNAYSMIQQAQEAVAQAYELVQASITDAIKHTQEQLDAHNDEIAQDMTRIGKDADIERLKRERIALEKDLSQEQRELVKAREVQAEREYQRFMAQKVLQDSAIAQVGGKTLTDVAATAASVASGNPGAAAKAGLDLLGDSKGGRDVEAAAQAVIQQIVDTIGQILGPLVPVIQQIGALLDLILKPLGAILGQIGAALVMPLQIFIQAVQPLFQMVGTLLAAIGPIIGPIVQISVLLGMLAEAGLLPLIIVVQMLVPAIEKVAEGIRWVINTIAGVWNGLIGALQSVLNDLASISVFGGHPFAFLGNLASDMNGAKIDVNGFDAAVVGTTASLQALQSAMNNWQTAGEKTTADSIKAYWDWAAYQQLKAAGDAKGAAAALANFNADLKQEATDSQAAIIAYYQAMIKQYGGSANDTSSADAGKNETWQQALDAAMLAQAEANAQNTSSTNANTVAAQALTASMTNVPAMFKVAQVVDQITSGQYGGGGYVDASSTLHGGDPGARPGGKALDSRIAAVVNHTGDVYSGVVVNGGTFNITATNDQVFEDIKRKLTREKVTRTGTMPRDLTSRHTLAGTG